MNIPELTQRVDEIRRKYGIKIEWIKSGNNRANRRQKKVWIKVYW